MQLNNRRSGTTADQVTKDLCVGVERNRGGRRVRAERAPAVYDRRSGLGAALFLARRPETIRFVCRARPARKSAFGAQPEEPRRQDYCCDKLELEEAKTKLMVKALAELKVTSALIVISQPDATIKRSSRNISGSQGDPGGRLECLRSGSLRTPHLNGGRSEAAGREDGCVRNPGNHSRPVDLEKGSLSPSTQQVLFKVQPDANKIEVKKAVETLFKVKVVKVRMARYLGKGRRVGKNVGRRPEWKKAYVTP